MSSQDAVVSAGTRVALLQDVALFLFGVFLFGFFLFLDAPTHYKFYYYWVMIPGLFVVQQRFAELSRDGIVMLVFAFGLYMALSGLWSEPFDMKEYLVALRSVLAVLLFVVLLIGLAARMPDRFEQLLQVLCVVAALMAIGSMLYFYSHNPFPQARVHTFGRILSINRGAAAYGVFVFLAAGFALRYEGRKRLLFGAVAVALLVFIVMNQTRSALIATLAAVLVMVLLEARRKLLWLVPAILLSAVALAYWLPELWDSLVRRMPWRPAIWAAVFEQFRQAPLFGHGMLLDTSILVAQEGQAGPRTFPHAHNAYLATMRDGGVVGLLLLLGLMLAAYAGAIQVFRRLADARMLALMVYATIVITPITDRLFTKPREQWLFFWMPVALVVIYRRYVIPGVNAARGTLSPG